MQNQLRALVLVSDASGCKRYRVDIPFAALNKFNVRATVIPELPSDPHKDMLNLDELVGLISQYDIVILQRCYQYLVGKAVKTACDFLQKPFVFETDDDYFHLPETNPGFKYLMEDPSILAGYAEVLRMADGVTVSTEELRKVVYKYNKNVIVLPNNVEMLYCGDYGPIRKGHMPEEIGPDGKPKLRNEHGLVGLPSYALERKANGSKLEKEKQHKSFVRVGYTGTPTHRQDFDTIVRGLEKVAEKYKDKVWLVFVGDPYFAQKIDPAKVNKMVSIRECPYDLYMYQLRNIDVGIAPLYPNTFNMSKSPIKAIEYATWGTPSILPNYVTYTRDFTHEKNCLLYNNQHEFVECLEEIVNNEVLRENLSIGARDLVRDTRLEYLHAEERFNFYMSLVNSKPSMMRFLPDAQAKTVAVV